MGRKLLKGILCVTMALALMIPSCVTPAVKASAATQKFTLKMKNATMYVGEVLLLESYGTTKAITWKTSSEKIATVSKEGLVTAVKAGTATITATSNKESYTCKVKVLNPAFEAKKVSIEIGESRTVSITGTEVVSVKSSDKKIVKAEKSLDYYGDPYGDGFYYDDHAYLDDGSEIFQYNVGYDGHLTDEINIRGNAKGSATVTVKGANGKNYKLEVTVTDPYVITKVVDSYKNDYGDDSKTESTYKYDKYGNEIYRKTVYSDSTVITESKFNADGVQTMSSSTNYDADGNVTSIMKQTYDKNARMLDDLYSSDGYSRETKYAYDNAGNVISEIEYVNGEKSYEYLYEYDENGNRSYLKQTYFDDKGKMTALNAWRAEFNEYGLTSKEYSYENDKLVSTRTSWYIGLHQTEQGYEAYSKVKTDEGYKFYIYDQEIMQIDNADGTTDGYKVTVDKKGRVTEATRDSYKISFKYDDEGRIIYQREEDTDAEYKLESNYQYDSEGREILYTYLEDDILRTRTEYKYDKAGNLAYNYYQYEDQWDVSEYEYDKNGQMTAYTWSAGVGKEVTMTGKSTYTYDKDGNCVGEVNDENGVVSKTTCEYDKKGNLLLRKVEKEGKTYTDAYTFNTYGRLTSQTTTDFDGKVKYKAEYKYDKYGNETSTKFTQDDTGWDGSRYTTVSETKKTYNADNSLTSDYSYSEYVYYNTDGSVNNSSMYLSESKYKKGVETYNRSESSNMYDGYESASSDEYTYDDEGRNLSTIRTEDGYVQKMIYTYDKEGNLVKAETTSGSDGVVEYKSTVTYEYDARGNCITMTTERQNADGQTRSTSTMTYDAQDRLLTMNGDGAIRKYTYDKASGKIATLYEESEYGTTQTTYTYKLLSKTLK